jgi:hypothetical protein
MFATISQSKHRSLLNRSLSSFSFSRSGENENDCDYENENEPDLGSFSKVRPLRQTRSGVRLTGEASTIPQPLAHSVSGFAPQTWVGDKSGNKTEPLKVEVLPAPASRPNFGLFRLPVPSGSGYSQVLPRSMTFPILHERRTFYY